MRRANFKFIRIAVTSIEYNLGTINECIKFV